MRRKFWRITAFAGLFAAGATIPAVTAAQDSTAATFSYEDAVPNGTHFLVRMNDELSTTKDKLNQKFEARTLDPLQSNSGRIIAPGAKVRGHISRIEPAAQTGHARIWLTFDEIDTRYGHLPVVALVSSVPGDFSVKPGESKEGEIQSRGGGTVQNLQAAAAGAVSGASAGAAHGPKAAAEGAVAGGVTGFLVSSGFRQELDLPKGTKLDLVLDRPLYLVN